MPRRRAITTAAAACAAALVATAPTCSHALVAPRHGLGRARAPIGRRRHRWAPALRRRGGGEDDDEDDEDCLLYTSPSPRDATLSRMPSSA